MTAIAHLRQGLCPDCGKWCYRSRRGARSAARILHPRRRMYAYRCGPSWHYTSSIVRKPPAWRKERAA